MVIIRPIALQDLDQLHDLTAYTGYGLTTLPRDAKLLRRRIRESLHGFEKLIDDDRPRGETYLFVMEDLETRQVVGTSGVVSKVGGFEPFYAYRIENSVHESKELGVRKEIRVLHLVEDHNGPCEIGSLFLKPEYRRDGNGRLLSLSRFLFMAEHREYFDPMVIAEMRGVVDPQGHSPFWDALGRHFFDIDFSRADYLSMVNKKFIADLMPKHPVYIFLLPQQAQDAIGEVHAETRPAISMLRDEGFEETGMVDIFEAGPVVRCHLENIRTVRECTKTLVAEVTTDPIRGESFLIANAVRDFRACQGRLEAGPSGGVRLEAAAAAALNVRAGESVFFVTPRPVPAKEEATDGSDVSLY